MVLEIKFLNSVIKTQNKYLTNIQDTINKSIKEQALSV